MTDALSNVTTSNWSKAVKHVEKVEDAFRKIDFPNEGSEPVVESMVITLGDESDSDECYSGYDDGADSDFDSDEF